MTHRQFMDSIDWRKFKRGSDGSIRTKDNMCPLQVKFGPGNYVGPAKQAGLNYAIIMDAADNDCSDNNSLNIRRQMLRRMGLQRMR